MKIFTHASMALKFDGEKGKQFAMVRLEPKDMSSDGHSMAAMAPYVLRTAKSEVVNMEGCGGTVPGAGGICTEIIETKEGLTLKYLDGDVETTVVMEYINGVDVIRQTNTVKNVGKADVTLTQVSSAVLSGVCMGGLLDVFDKRKVALHYCRSHWQGEAQWRTSDLQELGIYHKTAHGWDVSAVTLTSVGSWSTGKYYPLIVLEDKECGKVWYMELEGAYNWTMEVGHKNADCNGGGMLFMEANCANENVNGFAVTLKAGESYTAPSCVYGCTEGSFEDGVHELLKYKRATTIGKWDKPYAPACFNDYMNCIWAKPTWQKLKPIVDAAAKAGCEIFCMDDGWQKQANGTWSINDELYGEGGLRGMIKYIADKGMIPGIWLEVENAFPDTFLHKEGVMLTRHGQTVNNGRASIDFTNKEAHDYIVGIFDMFYKMGIRFIKNDYNLSMMIGAENYGTCYTEGERKSIDAFYALVDEVKAKYPDLKIENCGSGAMRCDNGTLRHFELQSTTDQEFYYYNPSIIMGSLAYLAPEKAGIWSFPYPISFYENRDNIEVWNNKAYKAAMADGEQTVFNMVNALCGTLYLSGRIEHMDKTNFALVKEGVKAYKKYRVHNANAYPVYPCGHFTMGDDTYSALGLMAENKKKMTLAVWRRHSVEDTLTIDLSKYTTKKSVVKLAYPSDPMGVKFGFNASSGILTIKMPKANSARFFEITL